MNLLDRYLQAVRKYLSSDRPDDIIAELRANLLAEAEDTNDDWPTILKRHGHPILVALRYLPPSHLIGPTLYPFYRFTLKTALQIGTSAYGLICLILAVATGHSTRRMIDMALHYPVIAFNIFAWTTLVFVAAEWTLKGRLPHLKHWQKWNPESLQALSARKAESKPRLIFDFLAWSVSALCYATIPNFPLLFIGPPAFALMALPIQPAPVWHDFYLWTVSLIFAQLFIRAVAIFGPRLLSLDLIVRAAGLGALSYMVWNGAYFLLDPTSHNLPMLQTVNYAASLTMKCVLAFAALDFVWRVVGLARSSHQATSAPPSFPANSTAC